MTFKPVVKDHYFSRTFGDWLFDLTSVVPSKPETATRDLRDFSENELNEYMRKHKVLKELPINKEFESLENVAIAVVYHGYAVKSLSRTYQQKSFCKSSNHIGAHTTR